MLPPGAGQRKLADRLHRRRLTHAAGVRRTRLHGGGRFELAIGDWVQGTVLLTRRYEPELLAYVQRRLRDGGTMLDCGGHIGLVSLTAAQNPLVEVHAFEPNPTNADHFRRNLALNPGVRVQLNQAAVGHERADVRFALPVSDQSGIGHVSADGGLTVPQITLDDYTAEHGIDHVKLLKMDVEGYECNVLQGARRLLAEGRIGCVVTEVHEGFLERAGASRRELETLLAGFTARPLPPVGLHRIRPAGAIDYDNLAFER